MMVVPLVHQGRVIGVLSILDRRSAEPYGPADLPRAELFAELAVSALPAAEAINARSRAGGGAARRTRSR
jgi:GAF domain-containing protein